MHMRLTTIQLLRNMKQEQQKKYLLRMRRRNLNFFKHHEATLKFAELMERRDVENYEIRFTNDLFDIVEKSSGGYCHPPGQLDQHVKKLAKPYHSDWIDLIKPLQENYGDHDDNVMVRKFTGKMYENVSDIRFRVLSGKLDMPEMSNNKLHSGPIVFLGIFHGLHVAELLNRIEPTHIMLIEPDIDAFLLSCYFIDYNALSKKFGMLNLVVGNVTPDFVIEDFIARANISSRSWVRFLKVYHDPVFEEVVSKVDIWFHQHDTFVPFKREIGGLINESLNLSTDLRIGLEEHQSQNCHNIAVVGSGPSLLKDIEWLREHQNNLIIITATSTSAKLIKYGIRPDFQIYMELQQMENIGLDTQIPTLFNIKSPAEMINQFRYPIVFAEGGKPNIVKFNSPLWNTHPSSLNVAFCLATLLNPKQIIFFGADMGACTDSELFHINDEEGSGVIENPSANSAEVGVWFNIDSANFTQPGKQIRTNAFLHQVKLSMEKAISTVNHNVQIYNCSDGVSIKGAEAILKEEIKLFEMAKKSYEELISEFPYINNAQWSNFNVSGENQLSEWKQAVANLFGDRFNWYDFTQALETGMPRLMHQFFDFQNFDFRMHCYDEMLRKIFAEWYRAMIFTQTESEASILYDQGREGLFEFLESLIWPNELQAY